MPISWVKDPRSLALIRAIERVHRGESTPEQAEVWAAESGEPPFVRLADAEAFRSFDASYWHFFLAAAWIVFRGRETATNAWLRHKFWGRAVWLGEPWHEAVQDLQRQLTSGNLAATGIRPGTNKRLPIQTVEWNDLSWQRIGKVDLLTFRGGREPVYTDVLLPAKDVQVLWRAQSRAVERVSTTAAAEAGCRSRLVELMRSDPSKPIPKSKLRGSFPGLPQRAFDRAYRVAVGEANAPSWSAAGRRPKN